MGRSKLTDDIVAQAQDLKRKGASTKTIASRLNISNGSVVNALRLAATDAKKESPKRGQRAKPQEAIADLANLSDEDMRTGVAKMLREIESDMAMAEDESSRSTLARTYGQLVTLLNRLTPKAPPKPEEHPDMIAAGERAVQMIKDELERDQKEPPCEHCGRRTV